MDLPNLETEKLASCKLLNSVSVVKKFVKFLEEIRSVVNMVVLTLDVSIISFCLDK